MHLVGFIIGILPKDLPSFETLQTVDW